MDKLFQTRTRLLDAKLNDLEASINDLHNLLESTGLAIFYVDEKFRLRRYTPAASELLGLMETDVGQPLGEIGTRVGDLTMAVDAFQVVDRLAPVDRAVTYAGARAHVRKMVPYRSLDRSIRGVLVTYFDVTAMQQTTAALVLRERQQAAIAQLGRLALTAVAPAEVFEYCATRLRATLSADHVDVLEYGAETGALVLCTTSRAGATSHAGRVPHEADDLFGLALRHDGALLVADLAAERRFAVPARLLGLGSAIVALIGEPDAPLGLLVLATRRKRCFDIDEVNVVESVAQILAASLRRARADAKLSTESSAFRLAAEIARIGSVSWMRGSRCATWNDALCELTGLPSGTHGGSVRQILRILRSADRPRLRALVSAAFTSGATVTGDFALDTPEGAIRTVRIAAEPGGSGDNAAGRLTAVVMAGHAAMVTHAPIASASPGQAALERSREVSVRPASERLRV